MQLLLASTGHYIGIAIDIAIVIILLMFACIGYYHGLLKSVLALFSTALVLFVAIYFANNFAKLINTMYDFTGLIARKLGSSIEKMDGVYAMTFPTGMSGSQFYSAYIATSDTNTIIKKFFKFALKDFSSESIQGLKVSEVLAGSVASIIMTIIAGLILFILIKIALDLLGRLFDNITRSKVLGGLNKMLGFVFGALKGSVIIMFFIVITICVSFVPSLNKKLYPLIQNDTSIVKFAYNTSDKYVEKYLIKSDVISKWINNLWESRHTDGEEPEEEQTIADKSVVIDTSSFVENLGSYTGSLPPQAIKSSKNYYRLNKITDITSSNVNITITVNYLSDDTISGDVYTVTDLATKVTKDASSTATTFVYNNYTYSDLIIELISSGSDINTTITITVAPIID